MNLFTEDHYIINPEVFNNEQLIAKEATVLTEMKSIIIIFRGIGENSWFA